MKDEFRNVLPPALTSKETLELIKEYKKTGDIKIRDKIVYGTMRLVADHVNKHCTNLVNCLTQAYPSVEDLIQEGACVIINSIESFDLNFETEFSTYLTACLKKEMGRVYNNARAKKRDRRKNATYSLNSSKNSEERSCTLEDSLADKTNYEKNIVDKLDLNYIKNTILSLFPEKDRQIFVKYYFENLTQQEIANQMKYSRAYVAKKLLKVTSKVINLYENGIGDFKPCKYERHPEKVIDK